MSVDVLKLMELTDDIQVLAGIMMLEMTPDEDIDRLFQENYDFTLSQIKSEVTEEELKEELKEGFLHSVTVAAETYNKRIAMITSLITEAEGHDDFMADAAKVAEVYGLSSSTLMKFD